MKSISSSMKIYWALIVVLALCAGVSVFFSTQQLLPEQELPASKPVLAVVNAAIMLVLYGGLGLLGVRLSRTLGFADIWSPAVSKKQRFLTPALVGVGIGVFFIVVDLIFRQFHSLGALPHPEFPLSLLASVTAGIGEEVAFRLFFISFWVWLLSKLSRGRYVGRIFWIVAVMSALAFVAGHIPSVMTVFNITDLAQLSPALVAEIVLLNGALSLAAAYYFRAYGFLAAVGVHFWADIIWHVIYGML